MTPLLLAVPLALAAPVPKDFKPALTDAQAVVGLWEIVECTRDNRADVNTIGLKYRFAANGGCTILHKTGRTSDLKCVLDPTSAPKKFLWDAPWGQWHGVYQLDGDKLVMVFPHAAKAAAPPAVAPAAGVNYSVLKRVKE